MKRHWRLMFMICGGLILVSFSGMAQDREEDQCRRTGEKSYAEIMQKYPFNQAQAIRVVSFQPVNAQAVEYELPKKEGRVDVTKLHEVKTLTGDQAAKLADLLMNTGYVPLPAGRTDRSIQANACYLPRHAILFVDARGDVFSYIEICLECLRYKTMPDNLPVGEFCFEKYGNLGEFFSEVGITYGLDKTGRR